MKKLALPPIPEGRGLCEEIKLGGVIDRKNPNQRDEYAFR